MAGAIIGAPGNAGYHEPWVAWPMLCGSAVTQGYAYTIDEDVRDSVTNIPTTMTDAVAEEKEARVGIALSDGAAGDTVMFCFKGHVKARVASAIAAVGTALIYIQASDSLDDTATASDKIVGFSAEAAAGAGLIEVDFDGINGFGIQS